jgi:hypothetical protein
MIIFTSICANYYHKAATLAQSVKTHMPDVTFVVCLLEREMFEKAQNSSYFDRVVLAKEAWNGNFERFIFKHRLVEASTSVKAQFFKFLYQEYPEETQFVYLDPDIMVYADFVELKHLLKQRPIVLCPHLLQPGNIDMEISSTAHGVYNLGFLAVNASDEAQRFINWWAERLFLYCYDDIPNGIFTDQRWIDLAPCFFDVEIFKHRGYDFATWSLLDAGMYEENGQVFVKGDPLRFIHYSGYGDTLNNCIKNWLPEGEHPFRKLHAEYSAIHDANNQDGVSKISWSYDYYESGEKVDDIIRLKYRKEPDLMYLVANPYNLSNSFFKIQIIFKKWIKLYSKIKAFVHRNGWGLLIKKIISKIHG